MKIKKKRVVFLDRDGVINIDKGYVCKIEDFELHDGVMSALKMLQGSGYLLMIITSQSGIGMGYYTEEDFHRLNEHMLSLFSAEGIKISKVYFCPHSPEESCGCRKPSEKFINEAEAEFGISLAESYMVGDKTADIEMGRRAGCTTVLVETGKAGKDGAYRTKPDFIAKDLYSAARLIIENGP